MLIFRSHLGSFTIVIQILSLFPDSVANGPHSSTKTFVSPVSNAATMPRCPTAPKDQKRIKGKEQNLDDSSSQKKAAGKWHQQKADGRTEFSAERNWIIHFSEQPEFMASKRMAVNLIIVITC